MWKSYNRFYTQTLKSETSHLFLIHNINNIPVLNKISLSCLTKFPLSLKGILMVLSGLQLIFNKKAQLIKAKKGIIIKKIKKGYPLGGKLQVSGFKALNFLQFLTFVVLPKLDLTKFFIFQEKNFDFKFFIFNSSRFCRLNSFFNSFQFLPPIQIVFSFKNLPTKEKIFFLRLVKFPVVLRN